MLANILVGMKLFDIYVFSLSIRIFNSEILDKALNQ